MNNNLLQSAKIAAQKRKELGIKTKVLNPHEKWEQHKTSLRKSINAKCWDCQGAGYDPGTKEAIRDCSATDCSLHEVRPYKRYKMTKVDQSD